MKREEYLIKIKEALAQLSREIDLASSSNLLDGNIYAETIFQAVFNELFGLQLVNTNEEAINYPAIDLIDKRNRIGIQVTSTTNITKVLKTLNGVVDEKRALYQEIDTLYIFMLKPKQKSYPQDRFDAVSLEKMNFVAKEHIWDDKDLFNHITKVINIDVIRNIESILRKEVSADRRKYRKAKALASTKKKVQNENIIPNLLEIDLPLEYYSASLLYTDNQIKALAEEQGIPYKKYKRSARDTIKDSIRLLSKGRCTDWIYWNGRLYTFRNLYNDVILSPIIDKGSIEKDSCEDFYQENLDYMRAFKDLIMSLLRQELLLKGIEWFYPDKVFRFKTNPSEPEIVEMRWKNKNESKRKVVDRIINKKDKHTICFRHLAFKSSLHHYNGKWFFAINPTYSFSNPFNVYKSSNYSSTYMAGIKRLEGNKSIYYDFKFISYILTTFDVFDEKYAFLQIHPAQSLEVETVLDDDKWKPPKKVKPDGALEKSIDNQLKNL